MIVARNEHYNDDIPSFSDHPNIQTSNRQMCIKLLRVYQVALQLDLQAGMAVRFSPVAVGFFTQGMTRPENPRGLDFLDFREISVGKVVF